jgi:hypothetical protein
VYLAWQLWVASGRRHVPTYEEVVRHRPSWIEDIMFADSIKRWVDNDSTQMQLANNEPTANEPVERLE